MYIYTHIYIHMHMLKPDRNHVAHRGAGKEESLGMDA